jgi:putative transposase
VFTELAPLTSTARACGLLGKPRATHYRRLAPPRPPAPQSVRPQPANALSDAERAEVLDVLHEPRFADKSVAQVWATLLDDGIYLASISSMYRVLRAAGEVRERRRQASHPARVRPELVARAPNCVWSWDITKLPGPARGDYFDLYVVMDIFSRYVPHWLVAEAESGELAKAFIADAICCNGGIAPAALHADRGTSMTSKPVAQLLVDLGVTRSHSRPHVSNDNPYSEAGFKTLKYCPSFPERFGSLQDAREFCNEFFNYYNHDHRHSGIGLHTPASMHHGTAVEIRTQRAQTLTAAYHANPHRFSRPPQPPKLPTVAWINQPSQEAVIQSN